MNMWNSMTVYLLVSLFFAATLIIGLTIYFQNQDEMIRLLEKMNENLINIKSLFRRSR